MRIKTPLEIFLKPFHVLCFTFVFTSPRKDKAPFLVYVSQMGSSYRNRHRLLDKAYHFIRIMKLTIDVSPKLADEILKLHNVHNIRSFDFTKLEEPMNRRRYDVADKVMTLVVHGVIENSRMLTLPNK